MSNYGVLEVVGLDPVSSDGVVLYTHAPWLKESKPGQFAMLKVGDKFLARPMSIMEVKPDDVVLWQIRDIGYGTNWLCNLNLGDKFHGWGPLGRGFDVVDFKEHKKIALVGGGVGMSPLNFLYKEFFKGKGVCVLEGNRTADSPFLSNHLNMDSKDEYMISTDDGSIGFCGNVVDVLENLSKKGIKFDHVYTCGPDSMLEAVEKFCQNKNVDCQVCLEARMACGFGGCRGCWDERHELMVCCDGPVLKIENGECL
tara:strand:+ start:41 stop:805 length:765 start_codon:yes stop_codon:yes gene_type:complete